MTFNASATAAAIEALIEAITFESWEDTPVESRTLELTITDADGATARHFPTFTQMTGNDDPFNGEDVGSTARPVFVDLDGDGDAGLVGGNRVGQFSTWANWQAP